LLHLDHVLLTDVEAFRQEAWAGEESLGFESLFFTKKMVEKFLLRRSGSDSHEAEVIKKVFQNVGADPPRGVIPKARSSGGVELGNGFHQANVSLLNEVQDVDVEGTVFKGDLGNESKIGLDKSACRVQIPFLSKLSRKEELLLRREERVPAKLF